jgi:hypothetical protein
MASPEERLVAALSDLSLAKLKAKLARITGNTVGDKYHRRVIIQQMNSRARS